MIYHPVLLGAKLVLLAIIVAILILLYGVLTPEQFILACFIAGVVFIGLVVVLWVVFAKILARPGSKLGQRFIHSTSTRSEDGYVAASDEYASLVGERGVALSALRPSGIVLVGDKRVPVVTQGDFIPRDAEVEIVSVSGARVVVRGIRPVGSA